MLQNTYLLAKIGADTAENERNFAKNWQLPDAVASPGVAPAEFAGGVEFAYKFGK